MAGRETFYICLLRMNKLHVKLLFKDKSLTLKLVNMWNPNIFTLPTMVWTYSSNMTQLISTLS